MRCCVEPIPGLGSQRRAAPKLFYVEQFLPDLGAFQGACCADLEEIVLRRTIWGFLLRKWPRLRHPNLRIPIGRDERIDLQ